MGVCNLCLLEKDLIKSHVIPDFIFRHMVGKGKPVINITKQGARNISSKKKLAYENMLCSDCDNRVIGTYESYASRALLNNFEINNQKIKQKKIVRPDGLVIRHITNIDYKKFKLFLLSILWRASICKDTVYSDINLGPHGERLRRMILNGDPGLIDDYPFLLFTTGDVKEVPSDMVTRPLKIKTKEGYQTIYFFLNGLGIIFYTFSKSHKPPIKILTETLKPSNELNVLIANKELAEKIILSNISGIGNYAYPRPYN